MSCFKNFCPLLFLELFYFFSKCHFNIIKASDLKLLITCICMLNLVNSIRTNWVSVNKNYSGSMTRFYWLFTLPFAVVGLNSSRTLDSFIWGNYPAKLRDICCSTHVPICAWNNSGWGVIWGLPPPVRLESRHITLQCWFNIKSNQKVLLLIFLQILLANNSHNVQYLLY